MALKNYTTDVPVSKTITRFMKQLWPIGKQDYEKANHKSGKKGENSY